MKKLLCLLILIGSFSAVAAVKKLSQNDKMDLLNSLVSDHYVYNGKDSGLRVDEAKNLIVIAMSGADDDISRSEIQNIKCSKQRDKSLKCSLTMLLETNTRDSDSGFDTVYKYEFEAFDDMTIYNLKTILTAG